MNDFERINKPRADKIVATIDMVAKSAASNRVSEAELVSLLRPVAMRLKELASAPKAQTTAQEPPSEVGENTPTPEAEGIDMPCKDIKQRVENFKNLPIGVLVDTMAAAGVVIAQRRR